MDKEFLGIDRRGPKIITNHKIQGLLRNDIFIIRKVPLVERFDIQVGDITKFYFHNGDFQYRVRYDEDWVRSNEERDNKKEYVEPLYDTDFSKLSWYFELNEVPCLIPQYIPPKGREDRIELARKYNLDIDDEYDFMMFGGMGPYSIIQACGFRPVVEISDMPRIPRVNTYGKI